MITITMSDDQARAVYHALRQQAAHEVSNAYRSLLSDTGTEHIQQARHLEGAALMLERSGVDMGPWERTG